MWPAIRALHAEENSLVFLFDARGVAKGKGRGYKGSIILFFFFYNVIIMSKAIINHNNIAFEKRLWPKFKITTV